MTVEQIKEEFGYDADSICKSICDMCTANDWYCPKYCDTCKWVIRNYDKAVERLAKLDGDLVEFCKRVKRWKGYGNGE